MLKDINKMPKGIDVTGDALIKSYEVRKTKNGNDFISGLITAEGGDRQFKVWGGNLCETLKGENYQGAVVTLSGRVDEYMDNKSLIIEKLAIQEGVDPISFHPTPYSDEYIGKFYETIRGKLSKDGQKILDAVMEKHGDRFQKEFAAVKHHDNVPRGLIAHSLKVARLAILITNMYPNLSRESDKDFYILAALLHDIGKIEEYHNGVFQEEGYLTHRYFGVRILEEFEEQIVGVKGQRWFNRLMSVITQHHGEFGERPQTVEAFIIHRLDWIEAQFTDLNTAMNDPDSKKMYYDGFNLTF